MVQGKTVLITGATGFLGSKLVEALFREGCNIVILKRSTSDLTRLKEFQGMYSSYDIDIESLDSVFNYENIDILIHTACNYGRNGESVTEIIETNLLLGVRLLDLSFKHGVKAFINTGTVLPANVSPYSRSKKQFYEWLKSAKGTTKTVNVRFDYMYGENESGGTLSSFLISQFKSGHSRVPLTQGEQKRDFIHVSDVVSGYLLIVSKLDSVQSYEEYDIGTGQPATVRSFVELLKHRFEERHGLTGVVLGFGDLPYRTGELMTGGLDIKKMTQLGWTAQVNLHDGVDMLTN